MVEMNVGRRKDNLQDEDSFSLRWFQSFFISADTKRSNVLHRSKFKEWIKKLFKMNTSIIMEENTFADHSGIVSLCISVNAQCA